MAEEHPVLHWIAMGRTTLVLAFLIGDKSPVKVARQDSISDADVGESPILPARF